MIAPVIVCLAVALAAALLAVAASRHRRWGSAALCAACSLFAEYATAVMLHGQTMVAAP